MKNRDKYMKQIYNWIPINYIVSTIGVNKDTNKPFECSANIRGDCDMCLFEKNGSCDFKAIKKWLNQEENNG